MVRIIVAVTEIILSVCHLQEKTPEKCGILLNGSKLEWVAKLTYRIWAATLLAPHAKLTSVLILGNFMEVLTIFYRYWEKQK